MLLWKWNTCSSITFSSTFKFLTQTQMDLLRQILERPTFYPQNYSVIWSWTPNIPQSTLLFLLKRKQTNKHGISLVPMLPLRLSYYMCICGIHCFLISAIILGRLSINGTITIRGTVTFRIHLSVAALFAVACENIVCKVLWITSLFSLLLDTPPTLPTPDPLCSHPPPSQTWMM